MFTLFFIAYSGKDVEIKYDKCKYLQSLILGKGIKQAMYNLYHFLRKYYLKQRGNLQTKDCKGFSERRHNKILWKEVGIFLGGTKPFPLLLLLPRVLVIFFS